MTSLSSPATNPAAAVPEDNLDVDVVALLDEYAALHRSMRGFCDDLLEKDTRPADGQDQVAQESTASDRVVSSAVPNLENRHQEIDLIASMETAAPPNTDSVSNVDDQSTARTDAHFSESLQNGDLSVVGNCLEDVSSINVNGDLSESVRLPNLADDVSVHNGESNELNNGKLHASRNAATTESIPLDGNKNTETGNILDSNGSNRTVSKETMESSTNSGSLTLCAAEISDNVELSKSDCCENICSTSAVDMTESEVSDAVNTGVVEATLISSTEDNVSSPAADNIQTADDCQTPCSTNASDAVSPAVTVVDDVLEVSLIHTVNKFSEIGLIFCAYDSLHSKYSL